MGINDQGGLYRSFVYSPSLQSPLEGIECYRSHGKALARLEKSVVVRGLFSKLRRHSGDFGSQGSYFDETLMRPKRTKERYD